MIPYRIALFFALCCVVATPHAAAQSNISASIQHGGVTRSFIVHLPPGFSTKVPSPLVMALHPASSSAAQFQSNSGWDAVADANRVVVVYPNGGNSVGTGGNFTWNGWEFTGAAPDDIGFLLTLIDHVHATYGTDACRTYMTGFSNGAMMTNSFVAAKAGKVAAIAPSGSCGARRRSLLCNPHPTRATISRYPCRTSTCSNPQLWYRSRAGFSG